MPFWQNARGATRKAPQRESRIDANTTLRYFDPRSGTWRVTFIDPENVPSRHLLAVLWETIASCSSAKIRMLAPLFYTWYLGGERWGLSRGPERISGGRRSPS